MAKPHLNQHGFSLLELLVGAVILAGVVVGLLRAFTSAQSFTPAQVAKSAQSNTGRERLEGLYEGVRQDWWSALNRPLSIGTHDEQFTGKGIRYVVSPVNPTGGDVTEDYRKVVITHTA